MNAKEGRKTFSSFTLIVSFVCLSLVGLALIPLLPVKLSPCTPCAGIVGSFFHAG